MTPKAFIFKHRGLYTALTEDGYILNKWDFFSEKKAKEYLPDWILKAGYVAEFIPQYWTDDRVKEAMLMYEGNYYGASFEGYCK